MNQTARQQGETKVCKFRHSGESVLLNHCPAAPGFSNDIPTL